MTDIAIKIFTETLSSHLLFGVCAFENIFCMCEQMLRCMAMLRCAIDF